jgi:2-methylcitrate dehydratase PrpD
VDAYPGFPTHPFSWADIEPKFGRLVGERADAGLRKEIQAAVRSLESVQVAELMRLIGQVRFRRLGRPLFQ